ncbi:hypothetical protein C8Q78DRAFT_988930 [Trametes maxima]|nr:hypothetical protein C8Q78DRAFT_988930 [Trametes maxima]
MALRSEEALPALAELAGSVFMLCRDEDWPILRITSDQELTHLGRAHTTTPLSGGDDGRIGEYPVWDASKPRTEGPSSGQLEHVMLRLRLELPAATCATSSPLATFQFSSIGQIPILLKRFSTPEASGQDTNLPQSPSPLSSPRASTSTLAPPASRKTLIEALGGIQQPSDMNSAQDTPQSADNVPGASGPGGSPFPVSMHNGQPFSAMNGEAHSSVQMNGILPPPQLDPPEAPYSLSQGVGPGLGTSRSTQSAISPFLPASGSSLSALNHLSPGVADSSLLQQDDVLDAFRNTLQRLHAESTQYSRYEEEARIAVARLQDQAARWHARADAVVDTLDAVYAQCERKVVFASNVSAEVKRLRGAIRRHEEEAVESAHRQTDLKARIAQLERAQEEERTRATERQRLIDARTEALRQTASQVTAEKTRFEDEVRSLSERLQTVEDDQAAATARCERLLAQLEEQKQAAAQEKHELLERLREQKRVAEQSRRLVTILEEKNKIDAQYRTELEERERTMVVEGRETPTLQPAVTEHPPTVVSRRHTPQPPPAIAFPASVINGAEGQQVVPKRDPQTPLQGRVLHPQRESSSHATSITAAPMKSESATPVLNTTQAQWIVSNRESPPETPATKKSKPELGTTGRKPSSTLTSTSLPTAQPRLPAPVKSEASTPLAARILQVPAARSNDRCNHLIDRSIEHQCRTAPTTAGTFAV